MPWVTDLHPTRAELDACVQCGLCLPVCPTFRLTGRETASPRGRLHAMTLVDQGLAPVDDTFAGIIDFCLGCRACEPVCPGLVPYGRALEGAKAEIDSQLGPRSRVVRWIQAMVPRRGLNRFGTRLLAITQRAHAVSLAPPRIRRTVRGVRALSDRGPAALGHLGGSGVKGRAGLLTGCVQDEWFRPVNRAAITLLEMAGYRVEAPVGQTCCGALAAHGGRSDLAIDLATTNAGVFAGYELVVAAAAGCSAHLAGYGHWGSEDVGARAVDVTVVVSRAIAEGLLPTLPPGMGSIAIQDPCHLRHAQRVTREPRHILEAAGFGVVETDPAGMCCGAAGLYAVAHPEASGRLGEMKADQVRATGQHRVASANPGCEMQLRAHLGDTYEIAHPIEWYLRTLQGLVSPTL